MKRGFGAVISLCYLVLGCSIENLDLTPDSKKQESSLDAEAKTTYNLKIASEEVSRYAGKTCFIEATSVSLSPDKVVAERLLTTQKTFAADLKTIELTLQAERGSKVEVFIRGKAYPNIGSVTANDQREDAERGCAWGRAEFEAGSGKDIVVSTFRTFLPPAPAERKAPSSQEGPSAAEPRSKDSAAAETASAPKQEEVSAEGPRPKDSTGAETASAPKSTDLSPVTPPPAPQSAPSSP